MTRLQEYGNLPVPWTVSWSTEQPYFVDRCPHARMLAIRQPQRPGEGRPNFGMPNFDRQRKTVILGLCDLCAKPLKAATKVSLSHAEQRNVAVRDGAGFSQLEPLLHRECARICLEHCPSLKKHIAAGTLPIRQITRWRPLLAFLTPDAVREQVPDYAGPADRVIGLAHVELLAWMDRDIGWLAA